MNNNDTEKTLIQYIRVSSDEQAKRGFSIPDQKRELDIFAEGNGYRVVDTVIDDGYESWTLERPGLDRARDMAQVGSIDAVVVWKRNRLSREPAHMWLLQQEFEEAGAELICLDSAADDSPEGQLMAGMLDQLSKYELLVLSERTRRGALQKARSGKIILGSRPNFGFKPNSSRDGYEVDELTMPVVRKIFELVAETGSVNGTLTALNSEGIPSPAGKHWTHTTIRNIVLSDVYKPYTYEEVVRMVDPAVASRLDPEKDYGLWYYNRRRVKRRREPGTYRRTTKTAYKDADQWIAVPVPDAGIERGVVDRARSRIENNVKYSNAGRRLWELSGGILKCGACGRAMSSRTVRRGNGRDNFYYVCRSYRRKPPVCEHVTHHRAEDMEKTVADMVDSLLSNPNRLVAHVEEKISELRDRIGREVPEAEAQQVRTRLEKLDRMKSMYQRQAAEELMTFEELKIALSGLEDERTTLNGRLERIRSGEEDLKELERDKAILMRAVADRIGAGLEGLTPKQRQDIYRRLDLEVSVQPEGEVELAGRLEANCLPNPEHVNMENGNLSFYVTSLSSVTSTKV